MRKIWLSVLGAALLASIYCIPASAQQAGPVGKWWRIPRVAEELGLTGQEKMKLDHLQLEFKRERIRLRGDVQEARITIDSLFDQAALDASAIEAQFKQMAQAQAAISVAQSRFLLKIRQLLGRDRFQRLRVLFNELRQRDRFRPRPPRRRP